MRKPRITKLGQGVEVRAHYPNPFNFNAYSERIAIPGPLLHLQEGVRHQEDQDHQALQGKFTFYSHSSDFQGAIHLLHFERFCKYQNYNLVSISIYSIKI